MRYFPLFVDLDGQVLVIVGDGEKAVQKLRLLAKSSAAITVIAPVPLPELRALADAHGATIIEEVFAPHHLDGTRIVFAATDDPALALAVSEAARVRGIQVNVVDNPYQSSFLVPALVDRDPIVVAIGSEGTAPVLARDIRARIEAQLPARIGAVARGAAELRSKVKHTVEDATLRKRFWERLLRGPWRDRVLASDGLGATQQIERELADVASLATQKGHVSLVGAGPGDPDLLTLRAQQRLQEADVIVFDGLVSDGILEHARRDARRIRAGKEGYGTATDQGEINRILIREAAKGHKVVRLKGGDPFVFGRAAEEMAAVRAAGIPVEVVPGITAAHACAASIGMPLTLREKVRQFSIVTGATASGVPDLDWQGLARPGHAFAIYMGRRTAPAIVSRLLDANADPDLPVVVVENGTRSNERVLRTTLAALPEALTACRIAGPTIVFVGLDWEAAHLSAPTRVETYDIDEALATDGGPWRTHDRPMTPEEIALMTHWVAG